MRAKISALLVALACAAFAVPALGAPTISGANGDVWNAATTPTYTITGTDGAEIRWVLRRDRRPTPTAVDLINARPSPATADLPGLPEGDQYRLWAFQVGDPIPRGLVYRDFAVDTTPPRVEITVPAQGAVYAQGQAVEADYRCDERLCVGSVPDGGLVPTDTPGVQSFSVTATDRAGNMVTVKRDYTVGGSAPVPLTPAPLVSAPAASPVVAPVVAGKAGVLPPPENARRLRPRLGAKISTRPVLRWRAFKDARLYNVQVFRLSGKRLVKVLSIFPKTNRVKVPGGRLKPGTVHVWRVWPMVGRSYTPKPLGISNFEVKRK